MSRNLYISVVSNLDGYYVEVVDDNKTVKGEYCTTLRNVLDFIACEMLRDAVSACSGKSYFAKLLDGTKEKS